MTPVLTVVAIVASLVAVVAGVIGWLTDTGARRADQAPSRPAGRQLVPLAGDQWAPACRSCGAQGDPITTHSLHVAFEWLGQWRHACPTREDR